MNRIIGILLLVSLGLVIVTNIVFGMVQGPSYAENNIFQSVQIIEGLFLIISMVWGAILLIKKKE